MIRDDWTGLVDAPRWWQLEYGLVLFGYLKQWHRKGTRIRLHIHVPDGDKLLTIRAEGIHKLTIEESHD
jgi:hypothetical protein